MFLGSVVHCAREMLINLRPPHERALLRQGAGAVGVPGVVLRGGSAGHGTPWNGRGSRRSIGWIATGGFVARCGGLSQVLGVLAAIKATIVILIGCCEGGSNDARRFGR